MKAFGLIGYVIVGSMASLGCGDAADETPDPQASSSALEFGSRSELYDWLVAEAELLGASDLVVQRGGNGEIESVQLPGDSRDVLLAKLQGDAGYFVLEGNEITLPLAADPAQPPENAEAKPEALGENIGRVAAAVRSGIPSSSKVCSGAFCLSGSSWNQHYSVAGFGYHDVGGNASSSGIWTTYTALVRGNPTCNTRIGCGPTQYYCQGDDRLEVTQQRISYAAVATIATCYHSVGFAAVSNTYFSNESNCGSGHCVTEPTAVTSGFSISPNSMASHSIWSVGRFIIPCVNNFGPAECYLDGVCSDQFAMGPGGSASTRTAAGSYDCL